MLGVGLWEEIEMFKVEGLGFRVWMWEICPNVVYLIGTLGGARIGTSSIAVVSTKREDFPVVAVASKLPYLEVQGSRKPFYNCFFP